MRFCVIVLQQFAFTFLGCVTVFVKSRIVLFHDDYGNIMRQTLEPLHTQSLILSFKVYIRSLCVQFCTVFAKFKNSDECLLNKKYRPTNIHCQTFAELSYSDFLNFASDPLLGWSRENFFNWLESCQNQMWLLSNQIRFEICLNLTMNLLCPSLLLHYVGLQWCRL